MRECEQVEKTRQRFAAERVRMLSTRITPTGVASQMNSASVAPSMVNNNVGNSRQQVMPSSSQPSISGYGSSNPAHPHNNQQVHSHMSYMQRGQPQPMFPSGTRLPAAAIQPSSPAPSNVMYNASGNSQPNLNQMLRSVSGPSSGLGWNREWCNFGVLWLFTVVTCSQSVLQLGSEDENGWRQERFHPSCPCLVVLIWI